MYVLEKYNWSNITWDVASKAAFIHADGFRNDLIRLEFVKAKYRLTDLPADIEVEDVVQKGQKQALGFLTRSTYLGLCLDPRKTLYMLKDTEANKFVALAQASKPDYVDVPQPSLLHRLWYQVLRFWYRTREIVLARSFDPPMMPRQLVEVRKFGRERCGFYYKPRMVTDLKRMTYDEAAKAKYPEESSYHLDLFVIRFNEQGKGLGKKLLLGLLDDFTKSGPVEPTEWQGPAKMEFFASPAGRGFYMKHGFALGATFPERMPSGADLLHAFFYKNLTGAPQ